jgi:HPt (histidine-containing phosphotransfer) domain-containing protein
MREAVTFIREMGGDALLARVRDLFLRSAEQRLRAAHGALAAGDRVAVRRHAHSLCGGAAQWGAIAAHGAAAALEGCAESADTSTLRRMLEELELGIAEARVQLFAVDDEPNVARR